MGPIPPHHRFLPLAPLPIIPPSFWTLSHSIHTNGTLWICIQKIACVNSYFLIFPIPLGSLSTIKALSKCHRPPTITFRLSASNSYFKIKILLPKFSIFTSFAVFHACTNAIQILFMCMLLVNNIFAISKLAIMRPPFSSMPLLKINLRSFPSRMEIALHLRINSSMSMSGGHNSTVYLLPTMCLELSVLRLLPTLINHSPDLTTNEKQQKGNQNKWVRYVAIKAPNYSILLFYFQREREHTRRTLLNFFPLH